MGVPGPGSSPTGVKIGPFEVGAAAVLMPCDGLLLSGVFKLPGLFVLSSGFPVPSPHANRKITNAKTIARVFIPLPPCNLVLINGSGTRQ